MREPFRTDIAVIRKRARENMKQGPVTGGYHADRSLVVAVLNEALATEIVCVLRYKNHHHMARGVHGAVAAAEFLEHANEEQAHVELLASRIIALGGIPDFAPETLTTRSHTEYRQGTSLVEMIKEDLIAERIAIETYSDMARWLGEDDPTSRRLIETILEKEEEHADDLADLLDGIPG